MQPRPGGAPREPTRLPRATRAALSAVIALHLLAVAAGPWSFRPTRSALAATVYRPLRPWIEALKLDNGYRFFAPEPSPSHLLRYQARLRAGGVASGVIPDAEVLRPRLLYHRHLVFIEFLSVLELSSSRDAPGSPGRRLLEAFAQSYATELGRRLGAREVSLWIEAHHVPRAELVARGMRLTDPKLYQEVSLGTFRTGDAP